MLISVHSEAQSYHLTHSLFRMGMKNIKMSKQIEMWTWIWVSNFEKCFENCTCELILWLIICPKCADNNHSIFNMPFLVYSKNKMFISH